MRNEENIEIINNDENMLLNRWTIDCKYYTADVNLCISNNLNELSDQFVQSINAVIIIFNIEKVNIVIQLNCIKCILHFVYFRAILLKL